MCAIELITQMKTRYNISLMRCQVVPFSCGQGHCSLIWNSAATSEQSHGVRSPVHLVFWPAALISRGGKQKPESSGMLFNIVDFDFDLSCKKRLEVFLCLVIDYSLFFSRATETGK